jgi:tRNA dimethylallyltransferase
MIANGLLEEAERIGENAVAASAVGYPQALAYLQGWCTRDEMLNLLVRATRRYAKRQATWFRSEPDTLWLEPGAMEHAAREMLGWV